MATDRSQFEVCLSEDVDLDDVSIDGKDLFRFYNDNPLEEEILYKFSGKDKQLFDLSGHYYLCQATPGLSRLTSYHI